MMDVMYYWLKEKLIGVKNNEIILQGKQNYSGGLWDIPIYKKGISKENYKMPPIYPGLYHGRK